MNFRLPSPASLLIASALLQCVSAAWAQGPANAPPAARLFDIDIAAQPLGDALNAWARQTGTQIAVAQSLVVGKSSPAVSGRLTARHALDRLLTGSGLAAVANGAAVSIRSSPPVDAGHSELPEVTVRASAEAPSSDLPEPFPGGQVARGGSLGVLGNTDLMEAPFNISSYTAQLIENQQARTVADVLANDPSVRNAATASAPGQYFLIRGFVSQEASILFNGLPGMAPYSRSSTEMAERVELLKGPSAAISGMVPDGSIGGTVMLVPKRAGDEPLTRLGLDYGTRSQFGIHMDIGRRFGDHKAWGIRFNGVLRDGESNIRNRDQSGGLASLALDYRGERLRAAVDVYRQEDKRDGADYYVGFAGRPSAVPKSSRPMTLGDSARVRDSMAMARIEYDLSPQATAFAAFGKHRYRSDWVYANPWEVDTAGNATIYSGSYRFHADLRSAEAGLRGQMKTGAVSHRITLAASDFKRQGYYGSLDGADVVSNIFDPEAVTDPGDPGAPPRTEMNRLKSVSLTDTLGLLDDRVLLTLGLRHQEVSAQSIWDDAPYEESALSPMAAVVFKLSKTVSLYANYIQGLSQGPVAPVGMDPELDNAAQVFPPYKSRQYEMGIKAESEGGLGSSLSLFQIAQPNSLTTDNRFTVDGEQRNRGVELNVYGSLGKRVRVLGGVTLIDAKVTKADGVSQGKQPFGVPSTQINLGGEWDVPGVDRLALSGRVLHTDSVYIDSANLYSIPSWTRWDVGARYAVQLAGRPVTLRANVENLFDKSYWIGYRQGWRSGMVSRSAPRTLSLSVAVDL